MRDFSVGDTSVPAAHRGSYLAFADDGNGTKHLKALAAAGLNTVHLLPTFDIASIEEDPAEQATPACDLAVVRAGQRPAAEVRHRGRPARTPTTGATTRYHWMAPEGSYASSATTADGGSRVAEFRTMVGGLHRDGLRVVLDQVFNHTPASGQARHLGARPGRARLLPAARRRRRGADLDLLPERRHRARHGPEDHGRLGRLVGAQLPGRRLPLRPHGAPQQGQHAGRARRRWTG